MSIGKFTFLNSADSNSIKPGRIEQSQEDRDDQSNNTAPNQVDKEDSEPPIVTVSDLEISSFIAWMITSGLAMGLLIWAMLPTTLGNEQGWYYLPDRYYILAISNWFIFSVIMNNWVVYALGMQMSHPRDSYLTMVDKHTILRPYKQNNAPQKANSTKEAASALSRKKFALIDQ